MERGGAVAVGGFVRCYSPWQGDQWDFDGVVARVLEVGIVDEFDPDNRLLAVQAVYPAEKLEAPRRRIDARCADPYQPTEEELYQWSLDELRR